MSQDRPASLQISPELRKNLSYVNIMKTLCATNIHAPEELKKTRKLLKMTIFESKIAQLLNNSKTEDNRLNPTSILIDGALKALGNPRDQTIKQLKAIHEGEYRAAKAEAMRILEELEKLHGDIKDLVEDKDKLFSEIVKIVKEKKPITQIDNMLQPLEQQQKALEAQASSLNRQAKALQPKLDNLASQVTQTARMANVDHAIFEQQQPSGQLPGQ